MNSIRKLFPYLRPHKKLILISVLLAVPLAALRTSPAPLVKYMMDDLLKSHSMKKLIVFPLLIIGVFLINFVVRFFHYYLLRIVVVKINQKVKTDLFDHVMGLSADYFTQRSVGNLISRVASDPQQIDGGVSCINVMAREPLTFLFLLGYALFLSWKLTIVVFVLAPFLAWILSATGRNMKRYITKMQEENAGIFSALQESFTGVRVIKAFSLRNYVKDKFNERNDEFVRFSLKTAKLEEASHPAVELLTAVAIAWVLFYGGYLVYRGELKEGELVAFFTTFALMMNPIRMLNDINIKLNQAAAASDRIFEVLNWKSTLYRPKNPIALQEFKKEISVENVTFAYPDAPERVVLKDISFNVPKGRTVALVGASGAGKSSMVSLIPRIFDVTEGRICVDGQDIRELSIHDLRSLIAVVSQDVFLFNDTVEENIRCGKLNATPEEIREAAIRAHAMDFIETLPQGLKTKIGDRGQKLSGGERQRLSIARAFLREAPILILDEATSSLDSASERIVQTALEELMQNRTTLIIAHRLSTIRNVDRILVIRDGAIVESGTHAELVERSGEYARFHNLSVVHYEFINFF